ncbi:MAG: response regulator transcription factor [Kibdelosporangium sp.]
MVRILVAENDLEGTVNVAGALRRHAFEVRTADSALSVVAGAPTVDLVVLATDLGDLDGLEACRRIRAFSDVPIIGTAAVDSRIDLVTGLRAGLDAYLVRPFGLRELVARVEAILRRTLADGDGPDVLAAGPLRINVRTREVFRCGKRIRLTRKEFDLLHLLASEPGELFSRRCIMARVWGDEWAQSDRTLDTHVGSLRNKLGDPAVVTTVRGVGFRIGYHDLTFTGPPADELVLVFALT